MNAAATILGSVAGALALGTLVGAAAVAQSAAPGGEMQPGGAVFSSRCKSCHEPAIERAPDRRELATRDRADIVAALTTGVMKPMAAGLSAAEIQAVAAYLGQPARAAPVAGSPIPPAGPAAGPAAGRVATAPASRRVAVPSVGADKMCEGLLPALGAGPGDWSSVNLDARATRHQPQPGFTKAEVPRLKLRWAFTMSGGGQAAVVGDWLFINNRSGKFYALDARTGCVRWVRTGVASRTSPVVVRSAASPSGWAAFAGLSNRTVRAFDAASGRDLWASEPLDANPVSGITGSLVASGDQLFVPMTSGEEGAAIQKTYACCTFRGSVAALDITTGKTLWRTSMIPEPVRPIRVNSDGVQMQGPAGAAIWGAPTVDAKRGLVYVTTGDSYTELDAKNADAVVAMDVKTGVIRWSTQVTAGDNYVMACEPALRNANCPNPRGPDHDFGASPILFPIGGGRDMLLAGQKSGALYGLAPDSGKVLWTTKVGAGGALGGIEWGMAADDRSVFVPVADTTQLFEETGHRATDAAPTGPGQAGLYALNPANGRFVWSAPAPKAPCSYAGDRSRDYAVGACIRAQSAPASVAAGLVFSGTLDGWLRAYDARTGKIVWAYSTTAQTYDTVNGVRGQPGGGIDGMGGGPVISRGMVYAMSGYNGASRTGANGNNVLLAFSIDGRQNQP